MNTITLYSYDKNQKIKNWNISVINNIDHASIKVSHGYLNGKLIDTITNISSGKNIGKKNETTFLQQAINDAESKINKKIKEGYSYNLNDFQIINNISDQNLFNDDINNDNFSYKNNEIVLPMLAQEFKKNEKKIKYPCYIQPKLDGYRMIFNPFTKKITSRTGNEFTILYDSELYKQLLKLKLNYPLDGELYVHKEFKFEDYGILRKKKLSDKDKIVINKIQYHVYDVVCDLKYVDRLNIINNIKLDLSLDTKNTTSEVLDKILKVETFICYNKDNIESSHISNINNGYEGSILRNADGIYKPKFRSYDLLKYKNFDDDEFEIVGITSEVDTSGNNENLIVWICKNKDNKTFNVQSKGTKKERQELFKIGKQFIGSKLWVQYFGFTNEGIPRFPKSMREGIESIRDNKQ